MRLFLMATALAALAMPAQAQTPPEGFTWYVLNQINRFYLDLDDPTNRPPLEAVVPEGVLVPVEINGDGQTDWLINWPEATQFCGTGGCQRSLYISGENGFSRAFDRQALDLAIGRVDGEVRIEAWLHHLNCDSGREKCLYAWAWDDEARRLVERPSSDGVTLLYGGAPTVIDFAEDRDGAAPPPPELPNILSMLWDSTLVVCPSDWTESGFEVRRTELQLLPDMTGDGLPEWLIQAPGACDAEPPPPQVWISQRNGDPILSLTARPGEFVSVDLLDPPQLVLTTTPCAEGGICETRRLVWRAYNRSVVPVR